MKWEHGSALQKGEVQEHVAPGRRGGTDTEKDNSLPLLGSMRLPVDFQLVFFLFCVV